MHKLGFKKIFVPLYLEMWTKPKPKKIFENIDSENASRDGKCVLGLFAVCPYAQ